jgi:hypothetical protein
MSRAIRWLLFALVAVPGVAAVWDAGATGAAAQSAPQLDIRIERDTRPRTSGVSNLSIAHTVTVRDRASGQVPQERYVVFAQATNQQGEKSTFFACGHTNDVDSRTPPGVYDCTVIVDHGGAWDFVAVVSEERSDPNQAPVPIAQASVAFELVTGASVSGEVPGTGISASITDVAVLFGHGAVAAGWFVCVALLSALALPGARRFLSTAGCHHLERRLDLIVKATWVTTGLVLGSGTYLTLTKTAYDAPFSSREVDAVFALPYGKPYFLTLTAKIVLYLLMVAAGVPLVRGARRRMLSSGSVPDVSPPAPARGTADTPAGGGVATAVRPAPSRVVRRPSGPGPVSATVVLAGGVGIAVCVTILKYLHELIESARGLL